MKRSDFIKSAGLSLLGISLFPSIAIADDNSLKLIPIPSIQEHVRHGQFQLSDSLSSSLTSSIERHVFYKNGHSRGIDDMHILKLELNQETLIINQIDKELNLQYGAKSYNTSINKDTRFNLDDKTVMDLIHLEKGEHIDLNPLYANSYLIPMTGISSMNDLQLIDNVLLFKATANITAAKASSLIVIHC